MIFDSSTLNFSFLGYFLSVFLAFVFGCFLFWRTARRELYESQLIFDFLLVCFLGAALGGRLLNFLARSDVYDWSLYRFIFFNAYGGFDFLGALFGAFTLGFFFARKIKENFWKIADLAMAPLALGVGIFSLGNWFVSDQRPNMAFYNFIFFFVMFWVLKRFDKRKRHEGFFVCFFLTFATFYGLVLSPLSLENATVKLDSLRTIVLIVIFVLSAFWWHVLSRRKLGNDLRSALALFLLGFFHLRRVFTSLRDADNFAKTIILLPLIAFKMVYFFVKLIGRELLDSFNDLGRAFGLRI